MPIVFIHGVAQREESPGYQAELKRRLTFLRRYIAPVLAPDPENVPIIPVYWGDQGVRFAWEGKSRPRSPLLGQGGAADLSAYERAALAAELHEAIGQLPERSGSTPLAAGDLVAAGVAVGVTDDLAPPSRLAKLTPTELSTLLVTLIEQTAGVAADVALAAIAADSVANDPATFAALAACATPAAERALIERLIAERYAEELAGSSDLAAAGGAGWLDQLGDRLDEALRRDADLGGFLLARAAVEAARKPLNELISLFFGDVFVYLNQRGDEHAPGSIPQVTLDKFAEAHSAARARNEPLVVLSHSMGGQIVYDLITRFLPQIERYADIRVDFWCATASQVGMFEEMKLLLASNQRYSAFMQTLVPFPDRRYLGGWWNVWDHNDVISFTVRDIFETRPEYPDGVDDEPYDAGMFIGSAHGGYLAQPSFYRRFAAKLAAAKAQNWGRNDAPGN